MKFQKITDYNEVNGTSNQGRIYTSISRIAKVFGPPDEVLGDKVTVEWEIKFEDNTIATIYDWKLRSRPDDDDKIEFQIGGYDRRAAQLVKRALNLS